MTRKLLTTTTAIALALSLTPPGLSLAQTAENQFLLAANEGKDEKKTQRDANEAQQEAQQAAPSTETTTESTQSTESSGSEQTKPAVESTQPTQDQQATERATEQTTEQTTEQSQSTEGQAQQTEEQPVQQTEQQSSAGTQATQSDQGTAEQQSTEQAAPAAEQAASQEQPAQEQATQEQASQPSAEPKAVSEEIKSKEQRREERRAKRKEKREERRARRERPAAAAALEQEQGTGTIDSTGTSSTATSGTTATSSASTGDSPAPAAVEVTSETVTAETTRSSNEDTVEASAKRKKKKDKDDDLAKIIGAGAGGLAAGVIIGTLLNDGGEVVENTGDRVIIERDGQYFVRKDENQILRRPGSDVRTETFADGSSRTVVERDDGTRVVTIRDADGYVVHRSRELPDGRTVLLFDDLNSYERESAMIEVDTIPAFDPNAVRNHQVDYGNASRSTMREVLEARPAAELSHAYTLRQVREIEELRDLMPSLDLDVITFDSGSAAIAPHQARKLDDLGFALEEMIAQNPDEVFLIEGHTDAVGSRIMNLALSDRRAESVALALTEYYDIPPENLFTQGYGEEYLKVLTEASERANRRATVRRITPLLDRTAQRQ